MRKRIWDFWPHDGGNAVIWREPCPFPADDADVFEYHRADLSADLVRAALERAAESADSVALPMDGRLAKAQAHYMRSVIRDTIRAIAKDDEAVAVIIASVLGETK
jgi:hypothetical protein